MTERKKPDMEIEERYSSSPEVMATYTGVYKDAMYVLSDPSMPDDVRERADQLAKAFAAPRAEKLLKLEADTKALARLVRTVVPEIARKRGLSLDMVEGSLLNQTFSPSSPNFQSLQIAERTGRLIELHKSRQTTVGRVGHGRLRMSGELVRYFNVPELMIGNLGPINSPNHPMFTLCLDLADNLGFIKPQEDWQTSTRIKRSGLIRGSSFADLEIPHPSFEYFVKYSAHVTNPLSPDGLSIDRTVKVASHMVTIESVDQVRKRSV